MSLYADDLATSSQVRTSGHHLQVTRACKLEGIGSIASPQISLSAAMHGDKGMKVADGMNLMRHKKEGLPLGPQRSFLLAQLVLGLLRHNKVMDSKVTFGVIDQMEILSSPDAKEICNQQARFNQVRLCHHS